MSKFSLKIIPNEISGTAQIYLIISFLDKFLKDAKSSERIKDYGNNTIKDSMPELVQSFFDENISLEDIADLKTNLENVINRSPVITITLSDIPDRSMKLKLVSWLRNINPICLIEFLSDPTIIGGLIIRSDRRRYDLSLRNKLENNKYNQGVLLDV